MVNPVDDDTAPRRLVFRHGDQRLRAGPWHGQRHVAYVTPAPDAPTPSHRLVRECIERLAVLGYDRVVTGALAPGEQLGFLQCDFELQERLHLLHHDLRSVATPPPVRHRRAGRGDVDEVLEVDRSAFDDFWRLDRQGLAEALNATPAVRFRVVHDDAERLIAYAISGKAGTRGYLQRLAVHPSHHRGGIGRSLTLDGLRWMRRRGVTDALVNTQERNVGAKELYESCGFVADDHGLSVLTRDLTDLSRHAALDAP